MKKHYIAISLLLTAAISMHAERISQADAALVANQFMKSSSTEAKAAPARPMVLKKAAVAQENEYFVYENANGEGWVMVSASDKITPILAFSETGHFRTDNMPQNLSKWLGKYNQYISKIETEDTPATEETTAEWEELRKGIRRATQADVVVGPLVKTTWDQDKPYYNLCPGSGTTKAYTGCVATAMAQVMNYWQWPIQGTGSHSYQPLDPNSNYGAKSKRYGTQSADFSATTYDWDNMLNSYSGSYTTEQATAVATLMYHCGVATEMMYGNDADGGSGTYTGNYGDEDDHACAQNALWMNFGYDKESIKSYVRDGYSYSGVTYYQKWSDADWTAMVKAELDLQHPIMYGGASNEGGHSFICDGYRSDNYFHFNWGWSGENDGYYKLSSLKPGGGGAGGGSYDFSEDQDVIIGIVPLREVDDTKTTLTYSLKGVELDANSTPAGTINKEEAVVASFTAKTGFFALSENTTSVQITIGSAESDDYNYEDGMLIVRIPAEKVTDKVTIVVVATVDPSQKVCDDYSHTFANGDVTEAGDVQLSGLGWTLSISGDGGIAAFDTDRGLHFGSNKKKVTLASFVTEETDGCPIESIVVNASRNTKNNGEKLAVFVGGNQIGETSITNTATDYTFDVAGDTGATDVRLYSTAGGVFYIKSIEINYMSQPATAIENVTYENEQILYIYNMLGQKIDKDIDSLTQGVYLIQTDMRTYKVMINK